jgi:hypothetical protein
MKVHELKTDQYVYELEVTGQKEFMYRVNDRNFEAGDVVHSRETQYSGEDMKENGYLLEYTGREMLALITIVFNGPFYTLPAGSCIMGFKKLI